MADTIYEFLQEKAAEQLDKAKSKVTDGQWFDSVLNELKNQLGGAGLEGELGKAATDTVSFLEANKHVLVGLGSHAFNLFIFQCCSGKDKEAIATYIRALTNADDLIALMNQGSDGVIRAKIELDRLNSEAKQLVLDILKTGAKVILPLLLTVI